MSPATPPSLESAARAGLLGEAAPRATWSDYLELTKPRLSLLSVLTALVGYLAARPADHGRALVAVVAGTALAAGGVAALNQWLEADTDARMRRTCDRPIPTGRIATGSAFVLGWSLCLAGLAILFQLANALAALFALATLVCYLALYTPAKRCSRWATEIGAVAGAFPPLIGWAAADGRVSALGWVLFGVLFFWQIPHFLAIAWMCRRDYAAVGFPVLPVRDPAGGTVAVWLLASTAGLVAVSLLPVPLGCAGPAYGAAAAALGGWFLWRVAAFRRPGDRDAAARGAFRASIGYLPLLLALLVADRLFF